MATSVFPGAGNSFDQELNTDDSPTFVALTLSGTTLNGVSLDNGAVTATSMQTLGDITVGTILGTYKSSDGTSGVSAGPFTTITGITVKNGIITALTGS
jgi:hypothetical protein